MKKEYEKAKKQGEKTFTRVISSNIDYLNCNSFNKLIYNEIQ